MSAREEMLARIRAAIGDGRAGGPAPAAAGSGGGSAAGLGGGSTARYRTAGSLGRAELLDLFAGRLTDYRAQVRRTSSGDLAATIAAALAARGARRIVVPPGFDPPIAADGVEVRVDNGLTPAELDAADGVVTGAAVAIAQTGTIVLDASPGQGRRALTLVPDYHLCVVRADQVVELVPEGIARLAGHATRPLTWISGPSATSDIELHRVEGVHGPRTLEVILVSDAEAAQL